MLRCERVRELIAGRDDDDLDLEVNPGTEIGYKNVIKVKGKYQARIYDEKEKRQRSLPGTFDTPKDAEHASSGRQNSVEHRGAAWSLPAAGGELLSAGTAE